MSLKILNFEKKSPLLVDEKYKKCFFIKSNAYLGVLIREVLKKYCLFTEKNESLRNKSWFLKNIPECFDKVFLQIWKIYIQFKF